MNELLRTLYITTPGTSLHLDSDTIRVIHPDKPGRHLLPLVRIDDIVAFNGVTVTDDLLHRCAADARPVTWVTRNGRFLARAHGPHNGNGLLRLAQARAHDNPDHRNTLCRAFIAAKLHNYRQLILRAARDATGQRQTHLRAIAERHATAITDLPAAASTEAILGIEGRAARDYFQSLPHLVKGATPGRTRRPPQDPVNCLLSFGYAMLRIAVHGACEHVGLDPHIGYLHGIRPAKPALALDLMEELRPLLVDRLVFTLLNRGQITTRHTQTEPGGAVTLTDDGRKTFLHHWSEARERTWHHATLNRDIPAGLLPLLQARLLARHLRGDTPTYHPWTLT
ncbi:type I-C CRISPR-associated endonuclease Cas1c [Actinokineospora guangxiensis]|uniref:CRISPR-associated endonuclease Cas1 n=1 Tax=Actinokineospora guangxiensis TaxID=1490288 RepID=A0ABW0EN30_9PSEU